MTQETSPLTGILEEDLVVLDFGEYEGKSIMEVADTMPDYYSYLVEQKNDGRCTIRRDRHKTFRLYVSEAVH